MSLDSLTDMVSNAVGVLILLLLMTALQSSKPHYEPPLPIEHQSGLLPKFYYITQDRIQSIDVNAAFANGLLAASESTEVTEFQVSADFVGQRHDLLTLTVTPVDTDNWPQFEDLQDTDTILGKTVTSIDNSKDFAFVFVHDEGEGVSFNEFSKVRQWFLDRGTSVGWLPVTDSFPAYLCSWSNLSACRYSPSFYGLKG